MHTKLAFPMQKRLGTLPALGLAFVALGVGSCGVKEYPHPKPEAAGMSDFEPFVPTDTSLDQRPSSSSRDAGTSSPSVRDASATPAGGSDAAQDSGGKADDHKSGSSEASKNDAGQRETNGHDTDAADPPKKDKSEPDHSEPASDAGTASPADSGTDVRPSTGAPTTPAEMPSIVLGGVPLLKKNVLAFVHIGHSNMRGAGVDPPELLPYFMTETHPRIWMYRAVGMPPELAREPTADVDDEVRAGPGVALLKQAADLAPDKYFMSLGFGRGGSICAHFTPGWPYFEQLTAPIIQIRDRVTFAAMIVMLGTIEALDDGRAADTIPNCFITLAQAIRELVGVPDLPLLFSDYEVGGTGTFSVENIGPQKVMTELAKVPGLVANSAIVPTDGVPMQDDHHFNLTGHMIWTKRVLDIMQARGWFPWATPPTTPISH